MLSRGASRAVARTARAPICSQVNQTRLVSGNQPGNQPGSQTANQTRSQTGAKLRGQSGNQSEGKPGGSPGLLGGIVGGALVFGAGYAYYNFSGTRSIVNAASEAKAQFSKLTKDIPPTAPESHQALEWLHSTAASYAAFIPGAKAYLDSAFKDLEAVQRKHGKEVDNIVKNTHRELKEATKKGLDLDSVGRVWEVLEKAINQIGSLAADSTNDILAQHPHIKEKVGGNLDRLNKLVGDYGPDAKKELDDTYQKIKEVLSGGLGSDSAEKIRKIVQEKIEKFEKFGDIAWDKGLEQAKPYLDNNPKIREIVEENKQSLKHGDLGELWAKVKEAASSGDTEPLQKLVKEQVEKRRSG